jgi:ornithine cyclodeaminase/alanine dehydrogenase-like protein (mu-crystallin family)
MTRILQDDDVAAALTMRQAVAAMREALAARARGTLASPARAGFVAGPLGLRWTPGALVDRAWLGLRLYVTGAQRQDQVTVLWGPEGALLAIALGPTLGRLRTGALGGLAIDTLARPDASVVGVVGFGAQGWQQVEAARVVRRLDRVLVYRRDAARLRRDAATAQDRWGIPVEPLDSVEPVVQAADILITATTASEPVLDARWVRPGTHINALGPKDAGRQEIGMDLVQRADVMVSDVPEQYGEEPQFFLTNTPHLSRLGDLATVMARGEPRANEAVTLFLSHGLPGTEVVLLAEALRSAEALGLGTPLTVAGERL